ncbi:Agmatinase, mitochondrial [Holothuria leucospilota]|uniref:Agmatinase, mitochondrial n=1 Tax=Holothuria leucospilota TaxID=206669 RepID=A0A9Q1BA83_HOLLE|nr:Agmatinase, mitochondrial [Holothuria leucospilota]
MGSIFHQVILHLRTVGSSRFTYLSHKTLCTTSFQGTNGDHARNLNKPVSGLMMPRSGGIATMMRLPYQESTKGLDACFVGVPFDSGCSNRSGTRLGPRQIRTESCLLREYNSVGAAPFDSLQVADIGDVNITIYNIKRACDAIRNKFQEIIKEGCIPLTLGGDHTISYPILQAIKVLIQLRFHTFLLTKVTFVPRNMCQCCHGMEQRHNFATVLCYGMYSIGLCIRSWPHTYPFDE